MNDSQYLEYNSSGNSHRILSCCSIFDIQASADKGYDSRVPGLAEGEHYRMEAES